MCVKYGYGRKKVTETVLISAMVWGMDLGSSLELQHVAK
jgi:hypothetical protein